MRDLGSPLSAAALGTLDFSLLYDQENNALHCTISKAKVGPGLPSPGPGSWRRGSGRQASPPALPISWCLAVWEQGLEGIFA